jgi:hypothetical protein
MPSSEVCSLLLVTIVFFSFANHTYSLFTGEWKPVHLHPGESAPVDEMGFQTALYTMDIGHNDINGVLHMPYDEMIANLPPVITEIKKAIEVTVTQKSYMHTLLLHPMI